MEQSEVKTPAEMEMEKLAFIKAKERSMVARWDIDIAVFLFAVLIIVIILLFENIGVEIVAPVAIFGLAMVWFVGWRRGNQLFKKFYQEELTLMKRSLNNKASIEETIEQKVQKALLDRFH